MAVIKGRTAQVFEGDGFTGSMQLSTREDGTVEVEVFASQDDEMPHRLLLDGKEFAEAARHIAGDGE